METGMGCAIDYIHFFSSYPTYEEWKRIKLPCVYTKIVCSYPTYEEWKLSISKLFLSTITSFLSYLWGMETVKKLQQEAESVQSLSYLWGMET